MTIILRPPSPGSVDPASIAPRRAVTGPGTARHTLSIHGPIAKRVPNFRERRAQLDLAELIEGAIADAQHVMAEAGTGVGKSLAYLVPAIQSGETAVVVTYSLALQKQLMTKDLPALQRAIGGFTFAELKGASNYVCLRDAQALMAAAQTGTARDRDGNALTMRELHPLYDAFTPAWDGEFDSLSKSLAPNVKETVQADRERCTGKQCPLYEQCYWQQAKQRAKRAQVIVTNLAYYAVTLIHAPQAVPAHQLVVIDEAHNLENTLRDHLTAKVSPVRTKRLITDLRKLGTDDLRELVIDDILAAEGRLWDAAISALSRARAGEPLKLPESLIRPGLALADAVERLLPTLPAEAQGGSEDDTDEIERAGKDKRDEGQEEDDGKARDELAKKWQLMRGRISDLARDLRNICAPPAKQGEGETTEAEPVRILKQEGREGLITLCYTPLDVAPTLRAKLYPRRTVVAVSATLASGPNDFSTFGRVVGMPADALTFYTPWAFNYPQQALLYIPRDLIPVTRPPRTDGERAVQEDYQRRLAERMGELVSASRGRAFLLFVSMTSLRTVYEQLAPQLADAGYTVLSQDSGVKAAALLEQFKAAPKDAPPVLFGVRSFWEGVDVPGEQLSLVAIDRIPYAPPDPLEDAMQEWLGGRTPHFLLRLRPQALIQIKQAAGRLIRTEGDRGLIALLDSRAYLRPRKKRKGQDDYGDYSPVPTWAKLDPMITGALPPTWGTDDVDEVRRYFARLAAESEAAS